MTRIRRITIVAIAFCSFIVGMWTAKAQIGVEEGPSRYLKIEGSDTMPYRLVLRHCLNAEDSMATLQVVDYTPERVVYRCVVP